MSVKLMMICPSNAIFYVLVRWKISMISEQREMQSAYSKSAYIWKRKDICYVWEYVIVDEVIDGDGMQERFFKLLEFLNPLLYL